MPVTDCRMCKACQQQPRFSCLLLGRLELCLRSCAFSLGGPRAGQRGGTEAHFERSVWDCLLALKRCSWCTAMVRCSADILISSTTVCKGRSDSNLAADMSHIYKIPKKAALTLLTSTDSTHCERHPATQEDGGLAVLMPRTTLRSVWQQPPENYQGLHEELVLYLQCGAALTALLMTC